MCVHGASHPGYILPPWALCSRDLPEPEPRLEQSLQMNEWIFHHRASCLKQGSTGFSPSETASVFTFAFASKPLNALLLVVDLLTDSIECIARVIKLWNLSHVRSRSTFHRCPASETLTGSTARSVHPVVKLPWWTRWYDATCLPLTGFLLHLHTKVPL